MRILSTFGHALWQLLECSNQSTLLKKTGWDKAFCHNNITQARYGHIFCLEPILLKDEESISYEM